MNSILLHEVIDRMLGGKHPLKADRPVNNRLYVRGGDVRGAAHALMPIWGN